MKQKTLFINIGESTLILETLTTYKEAIEQTGLSYYQLRLRASKGLLEAVKLPNGITALTKASVNAYVEKEIKK